jgi:hypothetical protein
MATNARLVVSSWSRVAGGVTGSSWLAHVQCHDLCVRCCKRNLGQEYVGVAHPKGASKTPGSGRKKGSRNKRSKPVEDIARGIIEDPVYLTNLKDRALAGTLPPMIEALMFHYLFGKPQEKLEVSGDADHPLRVTIRRA